MIVDHPGGEPACTFLKRIGVKARAPLTMVVDRATRIADSGADMPPVIYERLAGADATVLSEFKDLRIIQFANGSPYHRPTQLFLGGREVTGYAVVVPEQFANRHADMLRKLGVREKADHQVALQVLHDVDRGSSEFRPGLHTVKQAWHLLHEHNAIAAPPLAALRCLPTGNGDLRRPDECFFVDPRGLGHEFETLKGRLIERDSLEETYRAAGVRLLDEVLHAQVTPDDATQDDGLARWLGDFYPLLERIALHGITRDHEKHASALKERLEALTVSKAGILRQTLTLKEAGHGPETLEKTIPAYLDDETGTLFVQGGLDDVRHRGSTAVVLAQALTDYVFEAASKATRQRANNVLKTLIREDDLTEGADILGAEGIDQSPVATDNPWATSSPGPVGPDQKTMPNEAQSPRSGESADGPGDPEQAESGLCTDATSGDRSAGEGTQSRSGSPGGAVQTEPGSASAAPIPKPTSGHVDHGGPSGPGSHREGTKTKGPSGGGDTGTSSQPVDEGQLGPGTVDPPRPTPSGSPDRTLSDEPVTFPGRPVPDPIEARSRAASKAASNPAKRKAPRTVSVDVSRPHWDRKDSREYLFGEYHDGASSPRRPVCQICRRPSSFQTRDGEWYFEAVLLYPLLNHEDRFNRAALCPVCSAKLRLGRSTPRGEIASWARRVALSPGQRTIEYRIVLAGAPAKITFTADHLARIQGGLDNHDQRGSRA
jgi:hypothetical protein